MMHPWTPAVNGCRFLVDKNQRDAKVVCMDRNEEDNADRIWLALVEDVASYIARKPKATPKVIATAMRRDVTTIKAVLRKLKLDGRINK